MDRKRIEELLKAVQSGQMSIDDALRALKSLPYDDLGFAKIDTHRHLRRGFPEVIFGQGKTGDQIIKIIEKIYSKNQPVLVTRTTKNLYSKIETFLKKPGRSILLTLGSTGRKKFFLDILEALNKTDYNVIAVYGAVFIFAGNEEDKIPEFNDNILLKKYVPSMRKVWF